MHSHQEKLRTKVFIENFSTWNFRNLAENKPSLHSDINLFFGSNGQGKTNCLEALAVLGNIRSFRRVSPRKMVRQGESAYRINGRVFRDGQSFDLMQTVEISSSIHREFFCNGQRIGILEYLQYFPVFVFSSEDTRLIRGGPEFRRALLDRVVFFEDPDHLNELMAYQRILRQRNAALLSSSSDELQLWEKKLSYQAAVILCSRFRVFKTWKRYFLEIYEQLRGKDFPDVEIFYRREFEDKDFSVSEVAEMYQQRYDSNRGRDRKMGYTMDGPHRHDVQLRVGDRPLRDLLSSGQIKVVSMALILSGLAQVEEHRGEFLPLLVDDIDAELDERVLKKMVDFIGQERQIFLSTTNKKSISDHFQRKALFEVLVGELVMR